MTTRSAAPPPAPSRRQRGGFAIGVVVGLLVGLALALGVALYITKAPIPFINKVPPRTAEQDNAEAERNRSWDPNAPLGGKAARQPPAALPGLPQQQAPTVADPPPVAVTVPLPLPAPAPIFRAASVPASAAAARDPAAILAGSAASRPAGDSYIYFVQAGAFGRSEDAEQQRARLAMVGQAARITEREQAGRTVYRVRMGPYPTRDQADGVQSRLQQQTIEAQIVRVEKP